jgi:hypothetical protein
MNRDAALVIQKSFRDLPAQAAPQELVGSSTGFIINSL